jgi:hypothetical protein
MGEIEQMDERINYLIKSLEGAIEQDNLVGVGYDITDELKKNPNSFIAIEAILQLMEKYPDADFGMPGPLVHFVELFSEKGYEEKLVESIKRCPTQHTVWMLNRVINGVEGEKKQYYFGILKSILGFPNLNEYVKISVSEFISYQL